jgi:hypothetical protein
MDVLYSTRYQVRSTGVRSYPGYSAVDYGVLRSRLTGTCTLILEYTANISHCSHGERPVKEDRINYVGIQYLSSTYSAREQQQGAA